MELSIKIPERIMVALKLPEDQIKSTLRIELALSLYQKSILSFGKARELAGLSKWKFHELLGYNKIERHYDRESLEEDIFYGTSNNQ